MLPRQPARRPQLGFVYVPPFRIQGLSVAGEATCVQVPELDVVFDIGACPRAALAGKYLALSHGHMDHTASIAYYFSQRHFQGMGVGTMVCHPELEQPIHNLMRAWVDIERQRTPYNVVAMEPGQEVEIKNNHFLRAFATNHTCPSLGFTVIEKRSKLRADLVGLTQEALIDLKKKGENITQTIEAPLVCYTGDTMWGPHFDLPELLNAQVLITECTFVDPADRDRAGLGKHLHLSDVVKLLKRCKSEAVILTHLSRRTNIAEARKQIQRVVPQEDQQRLFLLMDIRANRQRYDEQQQQIGQPVSAE